MESEQYFQEITQFHHAALFGCHELLEDVDAGLLAMTQEDIDWMRKARR